MGRVIEIQPGDEVEVTWKRSIYQLPVNEAKNNIGTVVMITKRLIQIRHPLGYTFSVSKADLISGTKLTVTKQKEVDPMAAFEAFDRQTDEVEEPAASVVEVKPEVEPDPQADSDPEFHVVEGQDWKTILTPKIFMGLKQAGWSDNRIAKACGTYTGKLTEWKRENGLGNVRLKTDGTFQAPKTITRECDCDGTCGDACKCRPVKSPQAQLVTDQVELDTTGNEGLDSDYSRPFKSEPIKAELTVAQVVELMAELEGDIDDCDTALAELGEGNVRVLLESCRNGCSARLEQLLASKVIS